MAFAAELGVAIQTLQAWERSDALRYLNDLGARIVIASLIAPDEDWTPVLRNVNSIRTRNAEPGRVSACWNNEEAQWVVTSPMASN